MRLINPSLILRIISTILIIESIAFLICIPVALIYHERSGPFIWSALITFAVSTIIYVVSGKTDREKFSNRDGYLAVTISWIVFSLMGALPFLIGGTIPSVIDACFESISGFTTTGSSILNNVEILPKSVLFWRSLTQWIGGIGIIVLLIVILPSMSETGYQLFTLESSMKEKFHPKTKSIGYRVLFIYLALTAAEIILLSLGDMTFFESICHSFGTVATGGFSTRNSNLIHFSAYTQYVVMIFMFMAGTSQVIFYYLLKMNFKKIRQNEEFWFYGGVVAVAGAMATVILLGFTARPFEQAFREGFFQVISMISCTGYYASNYLLWPAAGLLLVFLLMFAGGSTGSTSGGIRMARHLIVLKNIKNAFVRLNHPKSVTFIKLNGKSLAENTNISILSFVVLYLFIFLLGTTIIVITGVDPVTASSSVATCMAGIGPGLGSVGPGSGFSQLPEISKVVLGLTMILGRLEIMTVLTIFTRTFWRL